MIIPSSILRPISQFIPKHRFSSLSTASFPSNIELQVQTILDFTDPIEDQLETLAPFFSPSLVSSVLLNQRDIGIGFRFYIWAMRRPRLRSLECQHRMTSMLCSENGFEIAWKLFKEMKQCGILILPLAFSVLISAYERLGLVEKALESFSRMKEFNCFPNTYTYNNVLHLVVKRGVLILGLALYNQMLKTNCSPNQATFTTLISGFSKAGKIEDALKLFDEMAVRGICPSQIVYSLVISSLCQANKIDDAHKLFDSMKVSSLSLNYSAHYAMIAGFCRARRVEEISILIDSWKKDGFVLELRGYKLLIDGLFRVGSFDEANKWYKKMLEESIAPDSALYEIMIKGHAYALKVEEALQFLNEMTGRGLVPSTNVYHGLLHGLCKAGFLKKARSLKHEITKHEDTPNIFAQTILISGLCKKGLVSKAQQLFVQMEKEGCFPSARTFNALIGGFVKIGKLAEAQMLFYKMEIGRNPSLYLRLSQGVERVRDDASLQTLVEQLCESGLIHKAYKLLTEISDRVMPNMFTYNMLINGFCKSGDINGAFKLIKHLQLKGLFPDAVTYTTLIGGLLMVKREADALDLLHQMEVKGCALNLYPYGMLMKYFCRERQLDLAFKIWMRYLSVLPDRDKVALEMVEESFDIQNMELTVQRVLEFDTCYASFDPKPYNIFLIGLCQAHVVHEALKFFNVLRECKIDVTPPSCVYLINCLLDEKEVDKALDVFLYTFEKGVRLHLLVCDRLIRSLFCNHKETMLDLVTRMKSAGYKGFLQNKTKILLKKVVRSKRKSGNIKVEGPHVGHCT